MSNLVTSSPNTSNLVIDTTLSIPITTPVGISSETVIVLVPGLIPETLKLFSWSSPFTSLQAILSPISISLTLSTTISLTLAAPVTDSVTFLRTGPWYPPSCTNPFGRKFLLVSRAQLYINVVYSAPSSFKKTIFLKVFGFEAQVPVSKSSVSLV